MSKRPKTINQEKSLGKRNADQQVEVPVEQVVKKIPITKEGLLNAVDNFLKRSINDVLQLPGRIGRAMTIIRKPYDANPATNTELENDDNINFLPIEDEPIEDDPIPDGPIATDLLAIKIGKYIFKLISKCVLFDRRFVNFNVYRRSDDEEAELEAELETDIQIDGIRWKLIHELTVYASSSQVGSWRLCKNEPGNRLNKFDDYVQSTVIQWKLSRFICFWFYRYQLPWDNEPNVVANQALDLSREDITLNQLQADQINAQINTRNRIRNNLFCVRPLVQPLPNPLPPLINITDPQLLNYTLSPPLGYNPHTIQPVAGYNPADLSAIPYIYVMEGNQYQYTSLPIDYTYRTQPDDNITCKIVDRGLGSQYKYSFMNDICDQNIGPLPAPCPFNYWNLPGKGNCGTKFSEEVIHGQLNAFSTALNLFYEIEHIDQANKLSPMKITELYKDCMVYKNFKQEATIFRVTLYPNLENILCIPPLDEHGPIPNPGEFYKQTVDIIFVNYSIKQWTNTNLKLVPCYHLDPQPIAALPEPEFNVQGYYVLTIIPTRVLLPEPQQVIPCDFNITTEIGLFEYYIKSGFYVCKPLDYRGQCFLRSFFPTEISTINLEYAYIGHRLNGKWPFWDLFGFNKDDRDILSTYTEQPIILELKPTASRQTGMTRLATMAQADATGRTTIEYIDPKLISDALNYSNSLCSLFEYSNPTFSIGTKTNQNKSKSKPKPKPKTKTRGGKLRKTNKNKKQYKNKLQTYKRNKCKQQKMKRKTKKNHKRRTIKI